MSGRVAGTHGFQRREKRSGLAGTGRTEACDIAARAAGEGIPERRLELRWIGGPEAFDPHTGTGEIATRRDPADEVGAIIDIGLSAHVL